MSVTRKAPAVTAVPLLVKYDAGCVPAAHLSELNALPVPSAETLTIIGPLVGVVDAGTKSMAGTLPSITMPESVGTPAIVNGTGWPIEVMEADGEIDKAVPAAMPS
ncbi:hypothetical protein D3C85_988800 [compost metagenome]